MQRECGSFDAWIWSFVDGKPIDNSRQSLSEIPARTPESDRMSKELLRYGFKFVGSTICYALMQATGMVNRPSSQAVHSPRTVVRQASPARQVRRSGSIGVDLSLRGRERSARGRPSDGRKRVAGHRQRELMGPYGERGTYVAAWTCIFP